MGVTTRKGELGEAMILADLQRKGYGVAIPFGHDLPFDLILVRRAAFTLEKVQWKYARPRLRLEKPGNGQVEGIRWASDHTVPELPARSGLGPLGHSEPVGPVAMLSSPTPE